MKLLVVLSLASFILAGFSSCASAFKVKTDGTFGQSKVVHDLSPEYRLDG